MKQAASLKNVQLRWRSGRRAQHQRGPTFPFKQMQMQRFMAKRWELFGPVMNGDVGS